jgi:hypothetical protein
MPARSRTGAEPWDSHWIALTCCCPTARSASSSSHLQARSVIAVENPEHRARLATFAANQAHVAAALLLLVFIASLARLRRIANASGMAGDGLAYLEAMMIGVVDASLAAQNAVAASEAMGQTAIWRHTTHACGRSRQHREWMTSPGRKRQHAESPARQRLQDEIACVKP